MTGGGEQRGRNDERRTPAAFRRDFRELLRTRPHPRAVEMVRADLDPRVRDRLQDVLLQAASDPQAQGRCIGFSVLPVSTASMRTAAAAG